MTGYQEIFTDPSYFGQLMVTTNAHIGNYGVNNDEVESDSVKISGLICRNFSYNYSRDLADDSLENFLAQNNLFAISDVDTRALVGYIRDNGSQNAVISTDDFDINSLAEKIKNVPSMEGLDLAKEVSRKEKTTLCNVDNPKYKIAAIDYGMKSNIYDILLDNDAEVTIFPASVSSEEILNYSPDGIFLSNGPGDPSAVSYGIETVKKLLGLKPMFGICLGHQMLALALGAQTIKNEIWS